MHRMTDREFESAVEEALERIPERFLNALENVAVVVEDEPNDYHLDALDDPDCLGASMMNDELLGLYDGVSLPDRADGYDGETAAYIRALNGLNQRLYDRAAAAVAMKDGAPFAEKGDLDEII